MNDKFVIKVAGKSSVPAVSGSIVKSVQGEMKTEIHAIGAGAVNQSVKAIANAQGILSSKGIDIVTKLGFNNTMIDGKEKTMIIFKLKNLG